MPSPQGPLLPRRRLGAELRRLRGDRTLDEVAAETLISTSKLSRLENGQGVPAAPRHPRSDQLLWRRPLDVRPLTPLDERRAAAGMVEGVLGRHARNRPTSSSTTSPALPSSGPTCRPFFRAFSRPRRTHAAHQTLYPNYTTDQVEKLVQVRLRRQKFSWRREDASHDCMAVIDEAAIRRALTMGSERDARAQLEHLRDVSTRRNVSIRILPLAAGLHAGMMGMFTIFQFSTTSTVTSCTSRPHSGDRYLEEQSSVLEYLRLFDAVSHRALDNSESRDLLTRLVEAPRP